MGNPINRNDNKSLNLTSKGVKWGGPSIPCLDLCTGDTVNSVVYKIAEKVCKLVTDYEELATLDYSCIIDLCNTENCSELDDPNKVSLKAIIQILLNNDCKLRELIETVEAQLSNTNNGGIVLSLDFISNNLPISVSVLLKKSILSVFAVNLYSIVFI